MMGTGHYRGGGVGRIKGFVSLGGGGEQGDRPVAPTGIGPGRGDPTLTGRLRKPCSRPPLILREPQHERPRDPGVTLTPSGDSGQALALSRLGASTTHRGRGDRTPPQIPRGAAE